MAQTVFMGGTAMLARPAGADAQILAVDLTVRPQGPHRTVVLPLPVEPDQADRVSWLPAVDHDLFTRLDALFHPLVQGSDGTVAPGTARGAPRKPARATIEGGIAVGRDGLVQAGLTGHTGEVPVDAVCAWVRVTPPRLPVWVRWLGFNWGWPKASLALRMPRPSARRIVFPTRGVVSWPGAFKPGPTLYVQTPRPPGPVWVDPQQAPGHPFDWRPEEREGVRPSPLDPEWPIFRAYCTDRAAQTDVLIELLDHGVPRGER